MFCSWWRIPGLLLKTNCLTLTFQTHPSPLALAHPLGPVLYTTTTSTIPVFWIRNKYCTMNIFTSDRVMVFFILSISALIEMNAITQNIMCFFLLQLSNVYSTIWWLKCLFRKLRYVLCLTRTTCKVPAQYLFFQLQIRRHIHKLFTAYTLDSKQRFVTYSRTVLKVVKSVFCPVILCSTSIYSLLFIIQVFLNFSFLSFLFFKRFVFLYFCLASASLSLACWLVLDSNSWLSNFLDFLWTSFSFLAVYN